MPETETSEDHLDVSRSTYVRIGTVVAIITSLWVPYQWLDSRFLKLERDMAAANSLAAAASVRMDDATRRIEAASADQWTRTDQRLFLLELALRNRSLVVPPVESKK